MSELRTILRGSAQRLQNGLLHKGLAFPVRVYTCYSQESSTETMDFGILGVGKEPNSREVQYSESHQLP